MICYVLAMGKQHLGPHVVVGYGIKIFWPGLFITSLDHLADANKANLVKKTSPIPLFGCEKLDIRVYENFIDLSLDDEK